MNIIQAMRIAHPLTGIMDDDLKALWDLFEHIEAECDKFGLWFKYEREECDKGYRSLHFTINGSEGSIAYFNEGEGISHIVIDANFLSLDNPTHKDITAALIDIAPAFQDFKDRIDE